MNRVALIAVALTACSSSKAPPDTSAASSPAANDKPARVLFALATNAAADPRESPADWRVSLIDDAGSLFALPAPADDDRAELSPVWSPDGARLALIVVADGQHSASLDLVDVDGGQRRSLFSDGSSLAAPRWSRSGHFVAVLATTSKVPVGADGAPLPRTWHLVRIALDGGAARTVADDVSQYVWVRDGDTLRVVNRTDTVWATRVVDAAGVVSPFTAVPVPPDTSLVSPSPDGEHIAFARPNKDASDELWTSALDGGDRHDLGPMMRLGQCAWSPDGAHLAFVRQSEATGLRELCVASGGKAVPVTVINEGNHGVAPAPIAWSPDSTQLAIPSLASRKVTKLLVVAADGSGLHEVARFDVRGDDLAWRPTSE